MLAADGRQRGKRNGRRKSDFSRARPKIVPGISQVTENGIYVRSWQNLVLKIGTENCCKILTRTDLKFYWERPNYS